MVAPVKKFISTMQFTWRFLSLAGLFLAVASASGLHLLRLKSKRFFTVAVSVLGISVVLSTGYFYHDLYENKYSDVYYDFSDVMSHTDHTPFQKLLVQLSGSEYLPAECDLDEVWLLNSPDYNAAFVTLTDYARSGSQVSFSAENHSADPQVITVPFLAYKGYHAALNGQESPVSCSEKGQVQLELPAGFNGSVTVKFTEPFYWRAAEIISLACILCGAVVQLISHNRAKHKKVDSILSEVSAS